MLDFLCSNQSILHLLTITNSYFIRFDVLRKYFSISPIFTIAVVGIRYTGIPKEFNNLSFLASLSCCTFFLCCLPSTSTTKYGFLSNRLYTIKSQCVFSFETNLRSRSSANFRCQIRKYLAI